MIITAPQEYKASMFDKIVFLAGTIDNGESEDWQSEVAARLDKHFSKVLNPRRPQWDPKATQAELVKQIQWELEGIEQADTVIVNFLPNSKSPISMLEMGICINSGADLIVICHPDFYRYTNIVTTCSVYYIETYHTLEEMYAARKW